MEVLDMKAVQGPYHVGFGVRISVGDQTVTIIAGTADMAEAIATYITDRQPVTATPMLAGARVKYEVPE